MPGRCYIAALLSEHHAEWRFDQYLHERYLSGKTRKIGGTGITVSRGRRLRSEKLAVGTRGGVCRYADDFVLIVKGTKAQAGNHQGRSVG